jgi:hypothetical protein
MDAQPDDPVSEEVLEHAIHRLNDGIPREEVISELVSTGVTELTAVDVVRRAQELHGSADRPSGDDRHPLAGFVKVVGYLLIVVGVILWIGNARGWLVTFPFAGLLTVVLGAGLLALARFREGGAVNNEDE